jgi:predicted Zn-ribbon and HTH transcriptional regulator
MDIGQILNDHLAGYRAAYSIPIHQLKVINAIMQCRTESLGGHIDQCDHCGYEVPFYNSCRNRHCPKCGYLHKERWLEKRKTQLLPITYFHTVFTLPNELNLLMLVNQKVGYNLLFRSGSETLLDLGRDPKHLGAEIGIIAMLHSWGQNLMDHPHLHCIVPGGGLSEDGKHWIYPKKMRTGKDFFVHVNVLSDLFKKKFLSYLKEAYRNDQLQFPGQVRYLKTESAFQCFINRLYKKQWVSYCREPFQGGEGGLKYLGKYIHKSAISSSRILGLKDGKVRFRWHDYRDGKSKEMVLDVFEFIRRFLLHILPPHFCRIRYYGILSSRNIKTKLARCMKLLNRRIKSSESLNWQALFYMLTGIDVSLCPRCKKGRMISMPLSHSPP